MKNNKRLKLNQNDKEILTIFWNRLNVDDTTYDHILQGGKLSEMWSKK